MCWIDNHRNRTRGTRENARFGPPLTRSQSAPKLRHDHWPEQSPFCPVPFLSLLTSTSFFADVHVGPFQRFDRAIKHWNSALHRPSSRGSNEVSIVVRGLNSRYHRNITCCWVGLGAVDLPCCSCWTAYPALSVVCCALVASVGSAFSHPASSVLDTEDVMRKWRSFGSQGWHSRVMVSSSFPSFVGLDEMEAWIEWSVTFRKSRPVGVGWNFPNLRDQGCFYILVRDLEMKHLSPDLDLEQRMLRLWASYGRDELSDGVRSSNLCGWRCVRKVRFSTLLQWCTVYFTVGCTIFNVVKRGSSHTSDIHDLTRQWRIISRSFSRSLDWAWNSHRPSKLGKRHFLIAKAGGFISFSLWNQNLWVEHEAVVEVKRPATCGSCGMLEHSVH